MQQDKDQKTVSEEKRLIRDLLHLRKDAPIEFNDGGWTSRVYLIDSGTFVFKFPREEKVKEEYMYEIPAYKTAYAVRGNVLIPEIQWEHPNKDYMGYRGIKGQPLYKTVSTLTPKEKQHIGIDLGTFLKQFHACPLDNAPTHSLDKEHEEYKQKLEQGMPAIREHLDAGDVEKIQRFVLEEYPQKMGAFGYKKGLCHGDLGYWNMIHNEHGKIGLIDFGDVGYYDTSIDFAGMNDKEILDAALEAYGEEMMREKIALRMKIIPIIDMSYFVKKSDLRGIEETIERMKQISLAS